MVSEKVTKAVANLNKGGSEKELDTTEIVIENIEKYSHKTIEIPVAFSNQLELSTFTNDITLIFLLIQIIVTRPSH